MPLHTSRNRLWTLLALLLVCGVMAGSANAQTLSRPDEVYLRLWCPSDIELYARELAARDSATLADFPPGLRRRIEADRRRAGIGPGQPGSEAETMRRVMYSLLRNWPDAYEGVSWIAGDRSKFRGSLLRSVWNQYNRELHRVLRGSMGAIPREDSPAFAAFIARWGRQPEADNQGLARTDLPQEMDCHWWAAIQKHIPTPLYALVVAEHRDGWNHSWHPPHGISKAYLLTCDGEGHTTEVAGNALFPFHIGHTQLLTGRVGSISATFPFTFFDRESSARFVGRSQNPYDDGNYFEIESFPISSTETVSARIWSVRPLEFVQVMGEINERLTSDDREEICRRGRILGSQAQ
jgi:hypothetical protein